MQLKDQHIFILGLMKFDSEIESTNYTIARHLAQHNHVYYIDNPYTWKDCVSKARTESFNRRKSYFLFNQDEIQDEKTPNLKIVITPPLMSINWLPEGPVYRNMLKVNERIILNRIKKVIRKYNIKSYIYINSFNFYYPGIADHLSPDLTVYQCVDPLVFEFEKKHGVISEEQIVAKSDLVVCTSKHLCDEKKKLNRNTFFVPNAADIAHSSKAMLPDLPVHASIAKLKKPVIGYFGHVERRIDYDMLKQVIDANQDKSFVLAGPVLSAHVPQWIMERKNVHFIGSVPYQQMPQVLKGFDVCIIPFKKDDVSANIFPLKLFEYLGAGKPVVATDFNPDLADYTGNTVHYCSNATSFSATIDEALESTGEKFVESRLTIAEQNTWQKRVDEFARLMHSHIQVRKHDAIRPKLLATIPEEISSKQEDNVVTF